MRVFVTGATGFVGSAVVQELLHAGHEVTGLARSEEAAQALLHAGAKVHHGSLDDPASLRLGAAASDGVIHTGFNHDFSRFKESCENDRTIIQVLGEALRGSDRPLIITSAIGVLPPSGRLAVENDRPGASVNPRAATEAAADAVAATGIRAAVLRLPPSVHGAGDHGFVPILINIAREKGLAAYKGQGLNSWSSVHRLDAARLYRLALESNFIAGARFHAIAEEGIAFHVIAETISKRLGVPVVSKSPEEAAAYFTWFTYFSALDCPASGRETQQQLNWEPIQPGLIADLDSPAYFPVKF